MWFLFVPIGLGHSAFSVFMKKAFLAWRGPPRTAHAQPFVPSSAGHPDGGAFAFRIISVLTRMIHQDSYLRVSLK